MHNLGHIQKYTVDATKPLIQAVDMDFNSVNILIGKNGVGKSFLLVMQWIGATFMIGHLHGGLRTANEESRNQFLKYLLDNALDTKDTTGTFSFDYENAKLTFKVDEGVVSNIEVIERQENIQGTPVIYMSSSTRLYGSIHGYLTMKNMLTSMGQDVSEVHENLTKIHKLYDIAFFEMIITRLLQGPFQVSDELSKTLVEKFGGEGQGLKKVIKTVSLEGNDIMLTTEDENKFPVGKLSNGEQAICTMFLYGAVIQGSNG